MTENGGETGNAENLTNADIGLDANSYVENRRNDVEENKIILNKKDRIHEVIKDAKLKNNEANTQEKLLDSALDSDLQIDVERAFQEFISADNTIPNDELFTADRAQTVLINTLEAVKEGIIKIPGEDDDNKEAKLFLINLSHTTIDKVTAIHIFNMVQNIITDPSYFHINNPEDGESGLSEFESEIERISKNEMVLLKIKTALRNAAEQSGGSLNGLTVDQLDERFTSFKLRTEGSRYSFEKFDEALEKKLLKDASPNGVEARRFMASLDSVNSFLKHYEFEMKRYLGLTKEQDINSLPEEKRIKAGEYATNKIHEHIEYVINIIFAEVLQQQTDEQFKQVASSLGGQYENPLAIYQRTIETKLSRLSRNAKQIARGTRGGPDVSKLPFLSYGQEQHTVYNETEKKEEQVIYSSKKLLQKDAAGNDVNFSKFTTTLLEICKNEKNYYEYGFNFKYATQTPMSGEQTFFKTIAGFAQKTLDSSTFDKIYAVPNADLIYAARITLENMYKQAFSDSDWRKTPDVLTDPTDVFDSFNKAEEAALEKLQETYKGEEDLWKLRRAFYHARTEFFGKEFMFQLLASYADPSVNPDGKRTYRSEGDKANQNAAFDITEIIKRWEGDPEMGGGVYIPIDVIFKQFDPVELAKLGKKLHEKTYRNGRLAYLGHEAFQDGHLLMDINNFSGNGGVDMQSGWRLKYTYAPFWVREYWDSGSHQLKVKNQPDTMFIDSWRSIDKIGVNVVKNFADNLLFGGKYSQLEFPDDPNKKGEKQEKLPNNLEQKYEQFFRFLYKRYFSEQEGIGNSMVGGLSEEEYIKQIIKPNLTDNKKKASDRGEALQNEAWKAMTVMLYERNPSQFVYSEKQRTTFGQILRTELRQHFLHDKQWTSGKNGQYKQALDDLDTMEQLARLDSLKKMKESEEKNRHLRGEDNDVSDENLYRITPDYMRKKMTEYLVSKSGGTTLAPQDVERINRLIEFHAEMTRRLKKKPEPMDIEKEWLKKSESPNKNERIHESGKSYRELYELAQRKKTTHVQTFMDTWKKGQFGMAFNSETAQGYLVRSATGEETVARAAGACADTAEAPKGVLSNFGEGSLWSTMKGELRSAEDKTKDLVKVISTVRNTMKNEDEAIATKFAGLLGRVVSNIMLRSDQTRDTVGKGVAQLYNIRSSIVASASKEGMAYDWDAEDLYKFNHELLHNGAMPKLTPDEQKVYKEVELDDLPLPKRLIARIRKKYELNKEGRPVVLQRDYGKEVSGEALRKSYRASAKDLFFQSDLPKVMMLLLVFLFMAGKEGFKEMKFD